MLRRIEINDAAGWKLLNNRIAARMRTDDPPNEWPIVPSVVYARNEIIYYRDMWRDGSQFTYAIIEKSTGRLIGDFRVNNIREGRAEYGHALDPRVWGTGITYETLNAVSDAAATMLLTLWGKVESTNIRSWRSLEKHSARFLGQKRLRIDGKIRTMRMYELPRKRRPLTQTIGKKTTQKLLKKLKK